MDDCQGLPLVPASGRAEDPQGVHQNLWTSGVDLTHGNAAGALVAQRSDDVSREVVAKVGGQGGRDLRGTEAMSTRPCLFVAPDCFSRCICFSIAV